MRRKKIGILIPTLTIGGAEKLALDIAQAMSNTCDVYLLVLKDKISYAVNEKVKLVCLERMLQQSSLSIKPFAYLKWMKSYLQKEKIECLLSFMEQANILNSILNRFYYKDYKPVLSIHTAPQIAFNNRSLAKRLMINFFYKNIVPKDINVISVSNGVKMDLERLYKFQNITTIHNPVNITDIIDKSNQPLEIKIKKGINIVSLGRLVSLKGYDLLINAFAEIGEKSKDVNLLIIGDGIERKKLEALVVEKRLVDKVFFLGSQSNPYNCLKQGDIFVCSSLFEGFGISIVEAMSLGLPVIATDCDFGPREILKDEQKEYGLLTRPLKAQDKERKYLVEDLKNHILTLIESKEKRTYYAQLSKERAKKFDITNVVTSYEELLAN